MAEQKSGMGKKISKNKFFSMSTSAPSTPLPGEPGIPDFKLLFLKNAVNEAMNSLNSYHLDIFVIPVLMK